MDEHMHPEYTKASKAAEEALTPFAGESSTQYSLRMVVHTAALLRDMRALHLAQAERCDMALEYLGKAESLLNIGVLSEAH